MAPLVSSNHDVSLTLAVCQSVEQIINFSEGLMHQFLVFNLSHLQN